MIAETLPMGICITPSRASNSSKIFWDWPSLAMVYKMHLRKLDHHWRLWRKAHKITLGWLLWRATFDTCVWYTWPFPPWMVSVWQLESSSVQTEWSKTVDAKQSHLHNEIAKWREASVHIAPSWKFNVTQTMRSHQRLNTWTQNPEGIQNAFEKNGTKH